MSLAWLSWLVSENLPMASPPPSSYLDPRVQQQVSEPHTGPVSRADEGRVIRRGATISTDDVCARVGNERAGRSCWSLNMGSIPRCAGAPVETDALLEHVLLLPAVPGAHESDRERDRGQCDNLVHCQHTRAVDQALDLNPVRVPPFLRDLQSKAAAGKHRSALCQQSMSRREKQRS